VNCWVCPVGTLGLPGVTAIDCSTAALTVITVEPLILPSVALMVDVPVATAVANPPLAMVATDVVAEAQVTWLVRFCVVLSEYVPVAVNCCVCPLRTLGLPGVTAIDCSTAALTVITVEPLILPSVALMVDGPVATAVANPPLVMVATDVVAEAQVTWLVRFCVVLSEYVPVAVNCWVCPLRTQGLAGVTAIDCSTAALTVITVEPLILPSVALMFDVPVATAVARPALVMVATEVVAEAQVTWLVRFCVVLSEYVPVAVNCSVCPFGTLGLRGVMAIDCSTAALTVITVEPLILPSVALMVDV